MRCFGCGAVIFHCGAVIFNRDAARRIATNAFPKMRP